MKKLMIAIGYVLVATSFLGCSNARKATLENANDPAKAVAEVAQIMQDGYKKQLDVLADKQFEEGVDYITDANDDLKEGQPAEDILDKAAIAKAYFQDAEKTAQPRKATAKRILDARQAALQAGLRNSSPLVKALENVDDDLKDDTDQFSKSLSPEDFSHFQKEYLALEVKAVQFRELNGAKVAIDKAIDDDAKDLAPKNLHTASVDYEDAENTIAQSPRSPDIYKPSVQTALESAMMLQDVMDVIKGAEGTPEHIAEQIVKQKRALGELTSNVGRLTANLKSTQQILQAKEGALKMTEGVLKSQQAQLERASTQVRFQQAMDEAQKVLPQSDALVYQQGNTLVFRLKRINFKSGTAIIPDSSTSLLTKVDSIIRKLDANKVVVQGYTDSVGAAAVNLKLSQERAIAVANYLSSLRGGYPLQYVGYGETNPIASNETAEGRAKNRRVDLVVSVKK